MKRKIISTLALSAMLLTACNKNSQTVQTEQSISMAAETSAVTKNAQTEQAAEASETLPLRITISEHEYNTDIKM
ncbi:MAG: hypothetical protein K2J76_00100, partial [Oscillospiraceae bacterium]|nr:hypothetical protein [Oscillospiraceae bacterium]